MTYRADGKLWYTWEPPTKERVAELLACSSSTFDKCSLVLKDYIVCTIGNDAMVFALLNKVKEAFLAQYKKEIQREPWW